MTLKVFGIFNQYKILKYVLPLDSEGSESEQRYLFFSY